MRKFLLRAFALNYIFGSYSVLRCATWAFPTFALYIIADVFKAAPLNYIFLGIFVIMLLISFIYFRLFPIKESEVELLSENQKIQYLYKTKGEYNPIKKSDNILLLLLPIVSLIAVVVCQIYLK
jgi:hypothetical protein